MSKEIDWPHSSKARHELQVRLDRTALANTKISLRDHPLRRIEVSHLHRKANNPSPRTSTLPSIKPRSRHLTMLRRLRATKNQHGRPMDRSHRTLLHLLIVVPARLAKPHILHMLVNLNNNRRFVP